MRGWPLGASCLALFILSACSQSEEAKRVELAVVTDGEGLTPITTDLGYEVELASATVVADNLQFAIAGEAHTSFFQWLSGVVIPAAHAHPGHYQGGEVTGELPGHFVLPFLPGETYEVGSATLVVGLYNSVNLALTLAGAEDVPEDDPLLGHTALLTGTAAKDGSVVDFEVLLDSPEGRELVGIPFEERVSESSAETLALRLLTLDPLENDTLFDGVDFAALDVDADGAVVIDPAATDDATVAAYNLVRRTFQTHDHFVVVPQPRD